MVIVGIIALSTALAVPNYSRWNATSQLKQAATELHGELTLARLSAMNRNRTVNVVLAIVNGRVTANFNDASGAQVMPPHTMLPLVNGVTGGPIAFSSLGVRVGGGAGNQLITLTNNQALIYSIAVTPAGKSTWCPRATCP
jgi:Tfp pilus assembly major pilin PilA